MHEMRIAYLQQMLSLKKTRTLRKRKPVKALHPAGLVTGT